MTTDSRERTVLALRAVTEALDNLLQATAQQNPKPSGHFSAWSALQIGRNELEVLDESDDA
jgi:hypothetical protein